MDGNKVNSAGIQKEVLYMLVSQPNNYPLPIQEGVDDKGNKVLSVADGAKQEVLRVHFQNNLSSYVKVIGIQVADQSNVLETTDKEEVVLLASYTSVNLLSRMSVRRETRTSLFFMAS